jgi:putative selenate reductase
MPFGALVRRMFCEFRLGDRMFDLPASKFWRGSPPGMSLGVRSHGMPAATPLGPAAGPHTQMAQNIVLAWLGGSRIMELKTVQIDDHLTIPRPCIDATNVGYNVEFSQELLLEQSLEEYVKAWMLIRMLEEAETLGVPRRKRATPPDAQPHFYDCIFDLSCGYNLAGISSPKVQGFIRGMMDATETIERLRAEIPDEFAEMRRVDFEPRIVSTATLSTFHGCPPDEIEKIVEFLLRENRLHSVIKMNPTMLGGDRLHELLHGVMGYTEISVNPGALTSGLQFDESIQVTARLNRIARGLALHVGAKFTNTLEVLNHREFFPKSEKVMYLSGAPLHPIAIELASQFRDSHAQRIGGEVPISFSAGVDKHNFADCVACGMVPVTVCTDLLRAGGYGRQLEYLRELEGRMAAAGAATVDEFIVGRQQGNGLSPEDAAIRNHREIAAVVVADSRYGKARNSLVPKRINSKLWVFDCIACDKCVPVCPNDANFTYEVPELDIAYANFVLENGTARAVEGGRLTVKKAHQIANFAAFCNECGNCDTFCPEYGGPFIEKPTFFLTLGQMREFASYDGFFIHRDGGRDGIFGRIKGSEYSLSTPARNPDGKQEYALDRFTCPAGEVLIAPGSIEVAEVVRQSDEGGLVDMNAYLTLRTLLTGVLYSPSLNYVNCQYPELAGFQSS